MAKLIFILRDYALVRLFIGEIECFCVLILIPQNKYEIVR